MEKRKKYSRSEKQKERAARASDLKDFNLKNIFKKTCLYECGCRQFCLAMVGKNINESLEMITEYMTPWILMDKKEHRDKLLPILEGCARGVTEGGHLDKR
jgi:hypothetical protein